MRAALTGQPGTNFIQPQGMVQVEVCALSGLLPGDDCPYRRREWFLAGTQPVKTDTFYQRVTLDNRTGLLADETTPPENQIEQLALDLPPTLHPWARAEGLSLLADLLGTGGENMAEKTATTAGSVQALSANTLRLISPDPHTIYRISPSLPLEAQKLRFEAIAGANFNKITLWLDDEPLATLTEPPFETWWPLTPGQHTAWAEGLDNSGASLKGELITFEVLDSAHELVD
jgi:penicillin-binding protein 1C